MEVIGDKVKVAAGSLNGKLSRSEGAAVPDVYAGDSMCDIKNTVRRG